jgi:hypothetical protein
MKTSITLLRIAGIVCLLFMAFHAFFHKMFDWPNSLACLDVNNRAILLTYHYISILITGFMAVVGLFQAKTILKTSLKYSVLGTFVIFFLIRIITEFTQFGYSAHSPIIFVMCTLPILCFGLPIFIKTQENENTKTI